MSCTMLAEERILYEVARRLAKTTKLSIEALLPIVEEYCSDRGGEYARYRSAPIYSQLATTYVTVTLDLRGRAGLATRLSSPVPLVRETAMLRLGTLEEAA